MHLFESVVREAQYQGIKKIASDLHLWHVYVTDGVSFDHRKYSGIIVSKNFEVSIKFIWKQKGQKSRGWKAGLQKTWSCDPCGPKIRHLCLYWDIE